MDDNHNQTISCPYCTYERNSIDATNCRICGTPLKPQSSTPSKIELRQEDKLDSFLSTPTKQSLPKQSLFANVISLDFLRSIILLTLSMIIIGGNIFLYQNRDVKSALTARQEEEAENTQSKLKLHSTLKQVSNVPQGLFWYGSSIPFAPLHTPKITQALTKAQPGFKIQYKEPPLYTQPGSTSSIAMLLDSMVSFAESSRPLKENEYTI
ncbi:MAG: hypothetical protein ACRC80_31860, partial [Waterburya sp.]